MVDVFFGPFAQEKFDFFILLQSGRQNEIEERAGDTCTREIQYTFSFISKNQ